MYRNGGFRHVDAAKCGESRDIPVEFVQSPQSVAEKVHTCMYTYEWEPVLGSLTWSLSSLSCMNVPKYVYIVLWVRTYIYRHKLMKTNKALPSKVPKSSPSSFSYHVYAYIRTCIQNTFIHRYIHGYIHTWMHACMHTDIKHTASCACYVSLGEMSWTQKNVLCVCAAVAVIFTFM